MNWELLWKVFFVLVVSLFGVMSVFVTIFGARDIRRLLRALRDAGDDSHDSSRAGDRNERR